MTVLDVIQRSSDFLTRKGVESPRLQIELLLSHVLQMPRMRLYLSFDRTLTETELEAVRLLVKRRGEREPLQHLVGSTSFCGLEMTVTRDVLVPRPETELLAEQAVQFLLASASVAAGGSAKPTRVLDFGTGSGCLAIVMAARCPDVLVHAVERSEAALAVARGNAQRHGVTPRIQFHCADSLAAAWPAAEAAGAVAGEFALVVSNPPYLATKEIASLQPEVRDFDPRMALDGGEDGLDFYRMLADGAGAWLKPGAPLMVELAADQAGAASGVLQERGWRVERIEKDYGGHERILIARR